MAAKKGAAALDLSALSAGFDDLSDSIAESGKPLELALDLVTEDPENLRSEGNAGFSVESIAELAATIKASGGLKTPISVKSANASGKYVINHGARRYRASILAGMTTIRAFIDDTHNDYDQAIENIQREALEPMEIALFIDRREKEGDKPGEIAERLGKKPAFISRHKSLLKMPAFLLRLYDEEQYKNVECLYELTKASKKHMEAVQSFVEGRPVDKLTLTNIRDFMRKIEEAGKPASAHDTEPDTARSEEAEGMNGSNPEQPVEDNVGVVSQGAAQEAQIDVRQPSPVAAGETNQEVASRGAAEPDHGKIKRAIVQVQHDERPARIMLDKRATYGVIWIKYEDDGHEIEVAAEDLALVAITEGA